MQFLFDPSPTSDVCKRPPLAPLCLAIDALRACLAAIDRPNCLGVETRRVSTVDDSSTAARLPYDALTTPMRAGPVIDVLGIAHASSFLKKRLHNGVTRSDHGCFGVTWIQCCVGDYTDLPSLYTVATNIETQTTPL